MSKILIIGNKGNMGRRYQLICEQAGHVVVGCDVDDAGKEFSSIDYDGVIIATPTDTHAAYIKAIGNKRPILCEKPITKSQDELKEILSIPGLRLRMINQYEYYQNFGIPRKGNCSKRSKYDYFRHGNDGIPWDMINILGLSEHGCDLAETSVIWDVAINGKKLKIANMDNAYVWNITNWLMHFDSNMPYIFHAHKKCWEFLDGNN